MHDVAPKDGPPLPYFEADGLLIGDEYDAARHLASAGANHLINADGIDTVRSDVVISTCQASIAQAVKTAVKSNATVSNPQ